MTTVTYVTVGILFWLGFLLAWCFVPDWSDTPDRVVSVVLSAFGASLWPYTLQLAALIAVVWVVVLVGLGLMRRFDPLVKSIKRALSFFKEST